MGEERLNQEEQNESDVASELGEPRLYRVLLHNDHYTTMEFVIEVLEKIFHKTASEATSIMLAVHKTGVGICGIYPFEIAETRVRLVETYARKVGFPLLCTMEEV
jgi:ATP-dependent Clp protease adaptor protein ClpS